MLLMSYRIISNKNHRENQQYNTSVYNKPHISYFSSQETRMLFNQ